MTAETSLGESMCKWWPPGRITSVKSFTASFRCLYFSAIGNPDLSPKTSNVGHPIRLQNETICSSV